MNDDQKKRMVEVGTRVSGLVHDLNNILLPIRVSVETLKREIQQDSSLEKLEKVERAVQRAIDLVRSTLEFAKGVEPTVSKAEVGLVLKELIGFFETAFPKNIRIHLDLSEVGAVRCSPTDLYQVILNLCVNARDALAEKGGTLSLRLTEQDVEAANRKGRFVVLEVADSGSGISKENFKRVGELFFTTKSMGTGIGLNISSQILERWGGFLSIESETGRGTLARIYLPTLSQGTKSKKKTPSKSSGSGCILVVDDEASLLELAEEILTEKGFEVVTASNGIDALECYQREKERISLVLTDVLMPGMDGKELVQKLRALAPSLPIIGMGGLGSGSLDGESKQRIVSFLYKPFTRDEILRCVQAALLVRVAA